MFRTLSLMTVFCVLAISLTASTVSSQIVDPGGGIAPPDCTTDCAQVLIKYNCGDGITAMFEKSDCQPCARGMLVCQKDIMAEGPNCEASTTETNKRDLYEKGSPVCKDACDQKDKYGNAAVSVEGKSPSMYASSITDPRQTCKKKS